MNYPTCHWPDGPKCFAFKGSECAILRDTHFKGCKQCPFFKTYSEVLKQDPGYFGKEKKVMNTFRSGITHAGR